MRSDSREKVWLRERARGGYEVKQDYVLLRTANSLRLGLEEYYYHLTEINGHLFD